MDEDYRWKLKALAHDAREMRAAKAEGYESFGGVYPYICGLTYHDQLCLPKLHWGRKVPELPLRELSQGRLLPPSPPKTLCEEAYRTVSHLNIRHALQLDPLLDDPCEAWFKKVLPYVLGEKKAPPQPSPWKAVTLDEQHLQALEATADALDILAEQLYADAAASDRAGQNTSAEAEPTASESGEAEPTPGESAEAEPTASESGEDEPTVDMVSIKKARKWFRDSVKILVRGKPPVSLEDQALKKRFIRAVQRGELKGGKRDNGWWVFEVESLRKYIENELKDEEDDMDQWFM